MTPRRYPLSYALSHDPADMEPESDEPDLTPEEEAEAEESRLNAALDRLDDRETSDL